MGGGGGTVVLGQGANSAWTSALMAMSFVPNVFCRGQYFSCQFITLILFPTMSHFRVFRHSPIYTELTHMMRFANQLPAHTYTILADKAFPLVKEVMTPYRGRPENLTPAERKFNRHLNSKRQVLA